MPKNINRLHIFITVDTFLYAGIFYMFYLVFLDEEPLAGWEFYLGWLLLFIGFIRLMIIIFLLANHVRQKHIWTSILLFLYFLFFVGMGLILFWLTALSLPVVTSN